MRQFLLVAMAILSIAVGVQAQGVSTYQVSNPYLTTSGSFTGTLGSAGIYSNPYYSTTRTVSQVFRNDTMTQKILGWQFAVAAQFSYTYVSGSPSAVVTTEVSCDTGAGGNYAVLYTDSVRNVAGTQTYSHVITGWPYSSIRLRFSGTAAPNSGNWKGVLIVR